MFLKKKKKNRKDPGKIPWGDYGAEYIAECTGIFKEAKQAEAHINHAKGAKKVVISAPAKQCPIFVMGVNHVRLYLIKFDWIDWIHIFIL